MKVASDEIKVWAIIYSEVYTSNSSCFLMLVLFMSVILHGLVSYTKQCENIFITCFVRNRNFCSCHYVWFWFGNANIQQFNQLQNFGIMLI